MTFAVDLVVARLEDAGVRLERGLTEADVKRVEKKFGFSFGPDHRALLRTALPLGDAWLNWRHATPAKIRERLQTPIEAVVDTVRGGLWPGSWGPRPGDVGEVVRSARARLAEVPVLVPLYGRHFVPSAPAPTGSPVFAVGPSQVKVRGLDLLDYVELEFGSAPDQDHPTVGRTAPSGEHHGGRADRPHIPFWSDLAASTADTAL